MSEELCRCGRPVSGDDMLCDRCRFYKSVFTPEKPVFESKKELALKAIAFKKMMRGKDKFIVVT